MTATASRTDTRSRPEPRPAREPQAVLPRKLRIVSVAMLCLFSLAPIAYLLLVSVTPDAEVAQGHLIPSEFALDNYVHMWGTVDLATGLANSVVVAGTAAVIATVLAVAAAYVLTRFTFLGRRSFLYSLVGLQAVPQAMLLLPLFVVYSSAQTFLGIVFIGSRPALILTYLTFALPFATWVMVSYLRGIPVALEEAALVDGTTRVGALWRIIVPLSWPGMVVALVFSFLLGWNDVIFANILTEPQTRTVAVGLQVFRQAQEGGALPLYGQLMGAAVVSALPVVLLYMFFQRYLLGGLTAGGVKG